MSWQNRQENLSLSREGSAALYIDGTHGTARLDSTRKHLEAATAEDVGKIFQFEAETQIRLIRAETLHSLGIRHLDEIIIQIYIVKFLESILDKALVNSHYIIFADKGHLRIYLRKFRLTVGAQIFITIATRYLEIAVKARKHEYLLIELRRLRKRIEFSVVNTAGNEIVACALRRRLDERRRFYIDKTVLRIVISCYLRYLGACDDIFIISGRRRSR